MCAMFAPNKWHALTAGMYLEFLAGLTYTFPVYSGELKSLLQTDQAGLSWCSTLGVIGGDLGLLAGLCYDVCGPKRTSQVGAVLAAIGFFLLYQVSTGSLLWGVPGAAVCFFITNQGLNWMDFSTVGTQISNFPNNKGTVAGLVKTQLGLSASAVVLLAQALHTNTASSSVLFSVCGLPVSSAEHVLTATEPLSASVQIKSLFTASSPSLFTSSSVVSSVSTASSGSSLFSLSSLDLPSSSFSSSSSSWFRRRLFSSARPSSSSPLSWLGFSGGGLPLLFYFSTACLFLGSLASFFLQMSSPPTGPVGPVGPVEPPAECKPAEAAVQSKSAHRSGKQAVGKMPDQGRSGADTRDVGMEGGKTAQDGLLHAERRDKVAGSGGVEAAERSKFRWGYGCMVLMMFYLAVVSVSNQADWVISEQVRYKWQQASALVLCVFLLLPLGLAWPTNLREASTRNVFGVDKTPFLQSMREQQADVLAQPPVSVASVAAVPTSAAAATPTKRRASSVPSLHDWTYRQALCSLEFWCLFGTGFGGTGAAYMTIDQLAQINTALGGSSADKAVLITLLGICNCLGRTISGFYQDRAVQHGVTRPLLCFAALLTMAFGQLLLAASDASGSGFQGVACLPVGLALTAFAFGSMWCLIGPVTSDITGQKAFGMICSSVEVSAMMSTILFNQTIAAPLYDAEYARQLQNKDRTCCGPRCYRYTHLIAAAISCLLCLAPLVLHYRAKEWYRRQRQHTERTGGGEDALVGESESGLWGLEIESTP
eukprot:gb/GEZN01002746.1/.p1 GENE.gb/GEZN01002746.1/~~gb/GEZN01002746.1/.p1  ORF type:complete len:767 (-),score=131.16 gb/GEZN01002746.1/:53-2353(-)